MMVGPDDNTTSRALVLDDRPRPSAREIFGGSLRLRRGLSCSSSGCFPEASC